MNAVERRRGGNWKKVLGPRIKFLLSLRLHTTLEAGICWLWKVGRNGNSSSSFLALTQRTSWDDKIKRVLMCLMFPKLTANVAHLLAKMVGPSRSESISLFSRSLLVISNFFIKLSYYWAFILSLPLTIHQKHLATANLHLITSHLQ